MEIQVTEKTLEVWNKVKGLKDFTGEAAAKACGKEKAIQVTRNLTILRDAGLLTAEKKTIKVGDKEKSATIYNVNPANANAKVVVKA